MRQCATGLASLIFLMLCLSSWADAPVARFTVTAYEVVGENPLSPEETRKAVSLYTGELEGIDSVFAAAESLQSALSTKGFNFFQVFVPPQTLTAGIIKLKVVAVKVGQVNVKGNKHYSRDSVVQSLPSLQPGKTPDIKRFSRELALANSHPAKFLTVNLAASEEPGQTNATVEVADRRPWQLFFGADNTGTPQSGRYRVSFGARYDALWGLDHGIAVSYSTSPENPADVRLYGLSYRAPLPQMASEFNAFFSSSDVDSGTVGDFFEVSGSGKFWGVDFTQHLGASGGYKHRWHLGWQDKHFENSLSFQNQPLGTRIRSRPLMLGYSGSYGVLGGELAFRLDYVRNLPGGEDGRAAEYAAARAGASRGWDAFKLNATLSRGLSRRLELRFGMNGQWANEPLIPSEQFGLGGVNSVRGFDERQFAGDAGARVSAELWMQPIESYNALRVLGFFDWGFRRNKQAAAGTVRKDTVSSVGVGLRWQWRSKVNLSLDYGTSITDGRVNLNQPEVSGSKLHANVAVVF